MLPSLMLSNKFGWYGLQLRPDSELVSLELVLMQMLFKFLICLRHPLREFGMAFRTRSWRLWSSASCKYYFDLPETSTEAIWYGLQLQHWDSALHEDLLMQLLYCYFESGLQYKIRPTGVLLHICISAAVCQVHGVESQTCRSPKIYEPIKFVLRLLVYVVYEEGLTRLKGLI